MWLVPVGEVAPPTTESPALTGLTEPARQLALERFGLLRPCLEEGVPLAHVARQCGLQLRTLQFAEGLSDRQAAEAVRARLDWKYLLGLPLDDPGFDFSVLSEFRSRLLAGRAAHLLLDALLAHCTARGWLKARGSQRTDSTHVLAAVRALNRLETVAETLRAALNALAAAAPDWLRAQVDADWFDRYSVRIEESRLPKGQAARALYAAQVGADGLRLLDAVYASDILPWLRELPAVEILRRVWVQQFVTTDGRVQLRAAADLPPSGVRINSPYDADERFGNKGNATWEGYKVHPTETCDANAVHLLTHVDTTTAPVADADRAEPIQAALLAKVWIATRIGLFREFRDGRPGTSR